MKIDNLRARLSAGYKKFKKTHPRRFKWLKVTSIVLAVFILLQPLIGLGYAWSQRHNPTVFGTSFSVKQAEAFGLNPQETLHAMLTDLGLKRVRLMSYWDRGEPEQGKYDFTDLDWQFKEAEAAHAKVSLAVGLRQPRWPECHSPTWAANLTTAQLTTDLSAYIQAVINRYKNSPALDSYQLENEFFNDGFGQCTNYDKSRFIAETNLVKKTDPAHPVIITLSNNFVGLPVQAPHPDIFGLSIYRRLYSTNIYHGYVTYPFPAWFYSIRAGWIKLLTGKDTIVSEFQIEPWGTKPIEDMTIAEQNESIPASDIPGRFGFAEATHIKTVDLWGAEWWYWRKVHFNDPSVWDTVKNELAHQ